MSTIPPLNEPSFRTSYEVQLAKLPPEVQGAHRIAFNALTDLYQATTALNTKVEGVKSSVSTITENVSTASETIIQETASNVIGFVNNQAGVTSYTTLLSDYGAEIQLNDASPIAVTLSTLATSPAVTLPFFCSFNNLGTGTATLTPVSPAEINGASSLAVPGGTFCIVYYDGTNFTAELPATAGSGVTQITAGTGISISPAGGTGDVTVTLETPVSIADGGTGTGSTLTGLVRGSASAMTAAEISGDATTSGSNTLTLATVNTDVGIYTNATVTINGKGLVTAAANGSGSGLPVNNPTFTGLMTGPQYASNGSTPNISAGAAAGASPTISITGNDSGGSIGLTPGIGASTGTLATITFATAYPNGCYVIIQSIGTGTYVEGYANGSTTGFTLLTNTVLTPSQSYVFIYILSGF